MRVRLLVVQQMTVIRMAANCAARATNCHLTNTRVMSVASARIAATAKNRLRRHQSRHHPLSHGRRHWHRRHHPDHHFPDLIHQDQ